MKTWLVGLTKQHTVDDLIDGAIGYKSVKSVLVECEQKEDVPNTVIKEDGYEIAMIEDWNLIQQLQCAENIRFIFK